MSGLHLSGQNLLRPALLLLWSSPRTGGRSSAQDSSYLNSRQFLQRSPSVTVLSLDDRIRPVYGCPTPHLRNCLPLPTRLKMLAD
ncbi:hypothetical protein KC19_VG036700 [Ceratodon purpureus]|uniref:Secreted protein n=1 Tax=Ceratodon purpureus TaxID=3225 RepID=A0A8T0HLM4_CERPU|nr:hypothetical protein KC19_VG036700 [Ceratodon purpureus]